MIRINLLPPEKRQPQAPLKQIFLLTALMAAITLPGIWGYGFFKIHQLNGELHQVRIQYELLKPTQARMDSASDKQRQIEEKNDLLLSLTRERNSWQAVMAHIGVMITPNVWLTEISQTEKNVLKLKGNAASYPELAGFIKKLEENHLLANTTLLNAEKPKETEFQAAEVMNFEVLIQLKEM